MERVIKKTERINDTRQWWKVKHKLVDIVMNVLFAILANADEWEEIEDFAHANEGVLRQYFRISQWNALSQYDSKSDGSDRAEIYAGHRFGME